MSDLSNSPKTIFLNALEIPSPEARQAYIIEQCSGDSSLAAEVQALLKQHQDLGSFLEPRLGEHAPTLDAGSLTEGVGTLIGPYKLLEQIGEGGMGVVFMAEQHEPVRRKVAMKLIKPGMDTRQVIARFEVERQALAVMDHPSIARVLDAGTTPSGHPYFVMELVRGIPITTYCDENNLPVRERLELFASVCQAIQHAHTKGIVHRDVKPTNVLVTRQDGRPLVKVIDFGVAKAMGQQLTEKTLFTNFAQMIGTPLYMSPEQAEQSGVDIDTRSDIYSLGVLLYELLTGSTPVDAEQMKQAAFDEVRRIIREDEPQTPSARISGSHTLPAIAAHRHIEPARLSKLVRGELDWIVMKALEKDRNRRYETANAFSADLLNYLHDEPVQACPPSATYRFRKFARRNRVAITTATLVAAALVLGTITSTWQAIRAETARTAEAEQRKVAESERSEAERQREIAEANFQRARQTVDEYFTLISESTLLDVPGLQRLRKELLDKALDFYEKTAIERTSDPGALADLAVTYLRVAQINHAVGRNNDSIAAMVKALDVVDRLRGDYPDTTGHHRRLAGFWKGYRPGQTVTEMPKDPLAAFKTLQRAIATWQQLVDEDPEHAAFQSDLSSLCYMAGLLMENINNRESLRYYERAKVLLEKLVVDQPDVAEHRNDLARVEQDLFEKLQLAGRQAEAEKAQRRSLALREELVAQFSDFPQYRGELAIILYQQARAIAKQDPAEAEKMFQRAVALNLALVREWPEAAIYYEVLGTTLREWGKIALASGKPDQKEHFEKAIQNLEALDASGSMSANGTITLVATYREIALTQTGQERLQTVRRGITACRRAIDAMQARHESPATLPDSQSLLARLYPPTDGLAVLLTGMRGHPEAVEIAEEFIATLDAQVKQHPQDPIARSILAMFCLRVAEKIPRQGDETATAERLHRRALTLFAELAREFPDQQLYLQQLARSHNLLGTLLRGVGQNEEAAVEILKAQELWQQNRDPMIELAKKAAEADPKNTHRWHTLGERLFNSGQWQAAITAFDECNRLGSSSWQWFYVAMAYCQLGNQSEAQSWFYKSLGWMDEYQEPRLRDREAEAAALLGLPDPGDRSEAASNYLKQGNAHQQQGEMDKAQEAYGKAVGIYEALVADFPMVPAYRVKLIDLLTKTGRQQQVEEVYRQAIARLEKLAAEVPHNPEYALALAICHNDLANMLRAADRPVEAEQAYRQELALTQKLVTDSPANPDYRFHLGHTYLGLAPLMGATNQPQEAEKVYGQAVAVFEKLAVDFPNDAWRHHELAKILAGLNKLQEAALAAQKAARLAPDDFWIHELLLDVLTRIGDNEHTMAILRGNVAAMPNSAMAHHHLGVALERQGRHEDAIAEFETTSRLSPGWEWPHLCMASNYAALGNWDRAGAEYTKTFEMDPGSWWKILDSLRARGGPADRERVVRQLIAAAELKPGHELEVAHFRHNLADELRSKGRHEEAGQEYRQAIVLKEELVAGSPANPDFRFHLGQSYLSLASLLGATNQPQDAETVYRQAVETFVRLSTDFPDVREYRASLSQSYFALIDVLLPQGKQADAESTLRQAIDEFEKLAAAHPAVPEYQRSCAAFLRRLAQLQAADKRAAEAEKSYLEAINSYQKIIAEFPQYEDLWRVYDGLARSLAATNRFDEADDANRKMVELAPNNAGTLNSLAWDFATSDTLQSRNASLAVELAKKGIDLEPGNVQLSNTLGVAYYRAGNWPDAIEWLEKSMKLRNGGDSFDWFFLAMAHWQLGSKDEARNWHAQAIEWMDANKPSDPQLLRFRTEAEELMKDETAVTDQESSVNAEGK
jgi:eukaryotic-like serine/threonine-protein kinase